MKTNGQACYVLRIVSYSKGSMTLEYKAPGTDKASQPGVAPAPQVISE